MSNRSVELLIVLMVALFCCCRGEALEARQARVATDPPGAKTVLVLQRGSGPTEILFTIPQEHDLKEGGEFYGLSCFDVKSDSVYVGDMGNRVLKRFLLSTGELIYNSIKFDESFECYNYKDGYALARRWGNPEDPFFGYIDASGAFRDDQKIGREIGKRGRTRLDDSRFVPGIWVEGYRYDREKGIQIFILNDGTEVMYNHKLIANNRECENHGKGRSLIIDSDEIVFVADTGHVTEQLYYSIPGIDYLTTPNKHCIFHVEDSEVLGIWEIEGVWSNHFTPEFDVHDGHLYYFRYYKDHARLMRVPLFGDK